MEVRTHTDFVADVTAVYIGTETRGSFGSGRLIAPDLVLTAGHVVDFPTHEAPVRAGWKIALIVSVRTMGAGLRRRMTPSSFGGGEGFRPRFAPADRQEGFGTQTKT